MRNSANIKKNIKAKKRQQQEPSYMKKIERDFTWIKIFFFHFLAAVVLLLGCMATPWAVTALIVYECVLLYVLLQKTRSKPTRVGRFFSWACLVPILGVAVMLLRYELLYFSNIFIVVSLLGSLGICYLISKIDRIYWSAFKCVLLTIVLSLSFFSQLALINIAVQPVSEETVKYTVEDQYNSGGRGSIPHLEINLSDSHGHQFTVSISEGYSTTNFIGKSYEIIEYKSSFGMVYMDYAKNNIERAIKATEKIDEDYRILF